MTSSARALTPTALVVAGAFFALSTVAPHAQQLQQGAKTADDYVRYDLDAPTSGSFKVMYEVSVTVQGATDYREAIPRGETVTEAHATDLMTGQADDVQHLSDTLVVKLARAVPRNGQGRIRLEKTVKHPSAYTMDGATAVWIEPMVARRGLFILPAGYQLIGCNLPAQIISQPDGRVSLSFMSQAPSPALTEAANVTAPVVQTLVVKMRTGARTGPGAAPTPLTDKRSWEPAPTQGPAERSRLGDRSHGDRDIVYYLQDPSTNSFSLFHDYTESRAGVDNYVNVVRTGSKVSNPSAIILDTGEVLKDEILRGAAVTAAKLSGVGNVTADTEVVVVHFDPVKPGQSVRLRISETYAAPESYRLEGDDLVFDRGLGRPRNTVVLPPGWYLTALSAPGMISETPDKLIRVDFFNGAGGNTDVLIKGRKVAK
jgi:hypothetical protein